MSDNLAQILGTKLSVIEEEVHYKNQYLKKQMEGFEKKFRKLRESHESGSYIGFQIDDLKDILEGISRTEDCIQSLKSTEEVLVSIVEEFGIEL